MNHLTLTIIIIISPDFNHRNEKKNAAVNRIAVKTKEKEPI